MISILDTIGSYIIGALVLLFLMSAYLYFGEMSQKTIANEMNITDLSAAGEIIESDFNNMGFRAAAKAFDSLSVNKIKIFADIDKNNTQDVIRYTREIITTGGRTDTFLVRYSSAGSNVNKVWKLKVKNFSITGYTASGAVSTNPDVVKSFRFSVEADRSQEYSSAKPSDKYTTAAIWKRHFYPKNLQF